MKPLVFNTDSWHYWLATKVGTLSEHDTDSNVCEYTRAVLAGVIWIAVGVALTAWALFTIVWAVSILQFGYVDAPSQAVFTVFFALLLFIGAIIVLVVKVIPWMSQVSQSDNFAVLAYRSWKGKTCIRVVIHDRNDS